MRLADFILNNLEPILAEWERFARGVWPGGNTDVVALRDHAQDILRATASDMKSAQTDQQQSSKAQGKGDAGRASDRVDGASDVHAIGRVSSGFDILAVVAEYRALRASVIRLWRESLPQPDPLDLEDLTRFNESIDQSLTEAIRSYTERVENSRQMFLAILGHDLRNPLNAMMMSADLLAMPGRLDPESSQFASRISSSAAAMGTLIGDLLDFTSSGIGLAMRITPAPGDLSSLCREVVDETRAAHPARAVRFESSGDLTGQFDAGRLRQMVSNLLGNAVQHGTETDPIDLTAEATDDGLRLAIRNSGTPIPEAALPTLFDPLVRHASADSDRPDRHGSIGLGLYIAREIVLAHGGVIDVESTPDVGTVFTVTLPRHARNRP